MGSLRLYGWDKTSEEHERTCHIFRARLNRALWLTTVLPARGNFRNSGGVGTQWYLACVRSDINLIGSMRLDVSGEPWMVQSAGTWRNLAIFLAHQRRIYRFQHIYPGQTRTFPVT